MKKVISFLSYFYLGNIYFLSIKINSFTGLYRLYWYKANKKSVIKLRTKQYFGKSHSFLIFSLLIATWPHDLKMCNIQVTESPKYSRCPQMYLQLALPQSQASAHIHCKSVKSDHSFFSCSERLVPEKKNQIQETQLEQVSI